MRSVGSRPGRLVEVIDRCSCQGRTLFGSLPPAGEGNALRLGVRLLARLLLGAGLRQIPIQYLLAVPVQHAVVARDMVVDLFEILDAMRLARNVGVDRERDDL